MSSISEAQTIGLGRSLRKILSYRDDVDSKDVEKLVAMLKGVQYRSPGNALFDVIAGDVGYSVKTFITSFSADARIQERRLGDEYVTQIRKTNAACDKGEIILDYFKETVDRAMEVFQVREAKSAILLRQIKNDRFSFLYWEEDFKSKVYDMFEKNKRGELTWDTPGRSLNAYDGDRLLLKFLECHNQLYFYYQIPNDLARGSFTVVKVEPQEPPNSDLEILVGLPNVAEDVFGF